MSSEKLCRRTSSLMLPGILMVSLFPAGTSTPRFLTPSVLTLAQRS